MSVSEAVKSGSGPGALASDRRLYQRQGRVLFTTPISTHSLREIKSQLVLSRRFARKMHQAHIDATS